MKSEFLFNIFDCNKPASDIVHVSCVPLLIDFENGLERLDELRKSGMVLLSFPFVSRGKAIEKFSENFSEIAMHVDGFTLQNFGDFGILNDLFSSNITPRKKYFLAGDYSLNVTNSETAKFWENKLDSVALLPELTQKSQLELIADFPKNLKAEVICTDGVVAMRSEHCFAVRNESFRCGNCGKYGLSAGPLEGENHKKYQIICNPLDCNCILTAENPAPLDKGAFAALGNVIVRY